ncbi:MAG: 50S ribosomal protein L4, partial [Rhizobiales bacterium]|nr:50S ribosomal protein L4 [Hyphomicrobiales bacterium]
KHALSAKARGDNLVIVSDIAIDAPKTKAVKENLAKLGWANALIIDGASVNENFGLATRNVPHIDVLPVQGINVYDILRREKLVLTKAAVEALQERFK